MAKPKMPYPVPGFKRCTGCQEEKRLEDFRDEPRVRSGTTAKCRICIRVANAVYSRNNQDRVKASRKKYAAKFPQRVLAAARFSQRRLVLERKEARIAAGKPLLEPRETDDGRRCSSCRRRKPKDQFRPNAGHYDGLSCYCRECANRKAREDAKKPSMKSYRRRYMKWYDLKKNYGLTREDFDALVTKQDGKCAICLDELKLGTGGCGVDHEHSTGTIRGILCRLCNVGIGHFRERPELFIRAIEYLRSTPMPVSLKNTEYGLHPSAPPNLTERVGEKVPVKTFPAKIAAPTMPKPEPPKPPEPPAPNPPPSPGRPLSAVLNPKAEAFAESPNPRPPL